MNDINSMNGYPNTTKEIWLAARAAVAYLITVLESTKKRKHGLNGLKSIYSDVMAILGRDNISLDGMGLAALQGVLIRAAGLKTFLGSKADVGPLMHAAKTIAIYRERFGIEGGKRGYLRNGAFLVPPEFVHNGRGKAEVLFHFWNEKAFLEGHRMRNMMAIDNSSGRPRPVAMGTVREIPPVMGTARETPPQPFMDTALSPRARVDTATFTTGRNTAEVKFTLNIPVEAANKLMDEMRGTGRIRMKTAAFDTLTGNRSTSDAWEDFITAALVDMDDCPGEIHPTTHREFMRFTMAVYRKLRMAEVKYGYQDNWFRQGWAAEAAMHTAQHIRKGDPLDVAIYMMFHHINQWSTERIMGAVEIANRKIEMLAPDEEIVGGNKVRKTAKRIER